MLTTLRLQGYRGFASYRLDGLTRVNLLVGRNNCGKTSILEAVDLLVAQGDPFVLRNAATRRSEHSAYETIDREKEWSPAKFIFTIPSVAHTFLGHRCEPGVRFEISAGDDLRVCYEIVSADLVADDGRRPDPLSGMGLATAFGLRIRTQHSENGETDGLPVIGVTRNGELLRLIEWHRGLDFPKAPAVFLGIDSWTSKELRAMWDDTIRRGREQKIVHAMRLLDSELESIHFLTGSEADGGILVGRRGISDRLPIGSLGEGVRRILALSLALTTARGYLLVDEVDTGLHWTVLDHMWRLVLATAKTLNVQVFATTHSYDCIRGLAAAVQAEPDFHHEVSVHKVHTALEQSVRLSAEDLQTAIEQDIEVR